MTPVLQEFGGHPAPESVAELIRSEPGLVLLQSRLCEDDRGRFSFLAARPFLTFRAKGSCCELQTPNGARCLYGNPWRLLAELLGRYELGHQRDVPFPLGGAFGYCGYEMRHFVEGRFPGHAVDDLPELPDCHLAFYSSLLAFDHRLAKTWIISTGLTLDGSRQEPIATEEANFWREHLQKADATDATGLDSEPALAGSGQTTKSNVTKGEFVERIKRAQRYIRSGDIYQVNLSQRFSAPCSDPWRLYRRLSDASPAPFAAFLDGGDFRLASSSPELFLRLSGRRILTRPIKGTRPRSLHPDEDAQLSYELQTSPKELAELLMITDLLRNDLGRVCEYGSVRVPDLVRLERYAQVHHLVSTIEGRLRSDVTHAGALAACFPGGSITGAPKIRAMQIIDELEGLTRGPYTGALGYLGFNHESQFNILIRTAIHLNGMAYFHAGAGIVADSVPEAEYEETLAKAAGFFQAVGARSADTPGFFPSKAACTAAPSNTD